MLISKLQGIGPDKIEIEGGYILYISVLIKRLGANLQRCNLADLP